MHRRQGGVSAHVAHPKEEEDTCLGRSCQACQDGRWQDVHPLWLEHIFPGVLVDAMSMIV